MPSNDSLSTTDTMQPVGGDRRQTGPVADAGLVLVYAPNFESLPAVLPLGERLLVIGREPPPGGFKLTQGAVSRMHARFTREDGDWTVTDLESRNGTLVNGVAIRERVLADGDIVRIGDALFKFVADDAKAYAPFRIDGAVIPPHRARAAAFAEVVGGLQMDRIVGEIATIAKTDLPVLLMGETGTGKEVYARAVHNASGRAGPFVAINCAAIPGNLLESELFGHRRGAFTGADRDRIGHAAAAHGGTLFLDEIGEMPLEAQAKLLRVLETREVTPLGSTAPQKVDVRLVCATHRDTARAVREQRFRADLYARIHGHALVLPPLRARKEDLFALVSRFLAPRSPRPTFGFFAALCQYDWPYNVRELKTAVERACALAQGQPLDVDHLPEAIRVATAEYGRSEDASRAPSKDELVALLAEHDGNLAAVGRVLGKDRAQIHRWLKRLGVEPSGYRK